TFRAIIHSRMKVGMEKYAQQFPKADILLFEPDSDDAAMFFRNVFSYAQRAQLCEYAYQKTRRSLLARSGELAPILARHGIALREDVLMDPTRTIKRTVSESDPLPRRVSLRHAASELDGTLRQLERWVAARVAA